MEAILIAELLFCIQSSARLNFHTKWLNENIFWKGERKREEIYIMYYLQIFRRHGLMRAKKNWRFSQAFYMLKYFLTIGNGQVLLAIYIIIRTNLIQNDVIRSSFLCSSEITHPNEWGRPKTFHFKTAGTCGHQVLLQSTFIKFHLIKNYSKTKEMDM